MLNFQKGFKMKKSLLGFCVLSSALGMITSAANAATTVTFVAPEKYADMPFASYEKDRVKDALKEHFEKLGAKLPAVEDFKVEVLDIDLAGERDFRAHAQQDLRILRGGADWPRIEVRYSIESQGKVVTSGTTQISDMNYLQTFNQYSKSEFLRYEKRMIDKWFKDSVMSAATMAAKQ
jgi:Protein of unknown function (DUF3016)